MSAHLSAILGGGARPSGGATQPARTGVVRWNGKALLDDTGFFHPLGVTMLWAMHGWKFERERFLANLDWLVANGAPDFLRILAWVDWPDNEIDPRWPDYDDVFLGTVDAIRARGMRVEVTIFGSPYENPVALAARLARLMAQRPGAFEDVEVWNEWDQNGGSLDVMQRCARVLLAESGVPMVALSSNLLTDEMQDATAACGAPLGTQHSDRGSGEGNWRMVRQGYDARLTRFLFAGNEPPGVNSSVNVLESPLQLALLRATQVISSGAAWVCHIGDMVMGIEDPGHHRHPNLWEVEVHDEITGRDYTLPQVLQAVRAVDAWLPEGVENWRRTAGNPNTAPQALLPDIAGWPDGGDGCNRFYAALDGPRFCQVLLGIKGRRTFTQVMPDGGIYRVRGLNPETGEVFDVTLRSGESFTIDGGDGMCGFILSGTRVEFGTFAEQVAYPPMIVAPDLLTETAV